MAQGCTHLLFLLYGVAPKANLRRYMILRRLEEETETPELIPEKALASALLPTDWSPSPLAVPG